MMVSTDGTGYLGDDIVLEDNNNGEDQHTYDNDTAGWGDGIDHSITNDDDEDNWSRQVETDDVIQRVPSSVTGGEINTIDDDQGASEIVDENSDIHGQHRQPVLIPQPRPLPTMKEKLVERERQRRVESERARWKRQFAMAAHTEAEHDEDENTNRASGGTNTSGGNVDSIGIIDPDRLLMSDRNSVAGTVGEDTVAPIDTLEEDNNDPSMNYTMERFLQEQHGNEMDGNDNRMNQNNNSQKETQGVVMERFLQEQPTAPSDNGFVTGSGGSEPVLNESSGGQILEDALPLLDLPSNDGITDTIENNLSREPMGSNLFQSPSQEPRVVLRLTEAEIQEMAAIDDASRSNAPPSERDDISELGELVSDFNSGLAQFDNQNMSQGTPVTAMESVTSSVGNQIGQVTILSGSSSDHGDIDGIEGHSVSSNIIASSAGGDVSLTGNPPSEVARDDDEDNDAILSPRSSRVPTEILPTTTGLEVPQTSFASISTTNPIIPSDNSRTEPIASNEIIVNRTMRPGLFNYKEQQQHNSRGNSSSALTPEHSSKSPNQQYTTGIDNHIEGFDFDKNNFTPPQVDIVATHDDLWSPGFSDSNLSPGYGTIEAVDQDIQEAQRFSSGIKADNIERSKQIEMEDESKALLGDIPPAVNIKMKKHRRISFLCSLWSVRNMDDLNSLTENIFSEIRRESTATRQSISNEADDYLDLTMMKRASPERMFALLVTLALEIPTFMLISGGSDKLCQCIGRTKYTTLIGLLPLVSAMSGNVGLQANALTIRAISYGQLKVESYISWLIKETGAAAYLGEFCNCFWNMINKMSISILKASCFLPLGIVLLLQA